MPIDPNNPFTVNQQPAQQPTQSAGNDPNNPFNDKDYSLGEALEGAKQNFGTSWANQLGNMGNAIMHPQDTVENMARTGLGEYDLALGQTGQNADMARALNKHFGDELTWKGFKKEMATDPASLMMDAGMVADPAIGGLAKAGIISDRAATLARAATNPVYGAGKAIGALAPGAGRLGSQFAGVISGVGGDATQNTFNAAEEGGNRLKLIDEAAKGEKGTDSATSIVDDTKDALSQYRNGASMAYDKDAEAVPWDQPMPKAMQQVTKTMQQLDSDFGPQGNTTTVANPVARKALSDMGQVILDWGDELKNKGLDPTIRDLDVLKKRLYNEGATYRGMQNNRAAGLVADKLAATVRESIDSPEYDTLTQNWDANRKIAEEMERTLSLGNKTTTDTAFRKLLSTQRDAINTGYGQRKSLMAALDAISPGLSDRISGMALSSPVPRGVARLGTVGSLLGFLSHGLAGGVGAGLGTAALDALATSPKVQYYVARTMGRMAPGTRAAWGATMSNPITTRAVQQAGNRFSPGVVQQSPFEQNNQ